MLKITKKVEYALIAMRHINNSEKLCSSREISTFYNIPHEIMAKTLQRLSKMKYVKAIKGSQGGYYLDNSIKKINLVDFIENMEGPIGIVKCSTDDTCDLIEYCNIKSPINKINSNIKNMLSKISLQDIAN